MSNLTAMLVIVTVLAVSTDEAVFTSQMGGNSAASSTKVFGKAPGNSWTKMAAKFYPEPMSMIICMGSRRLPFVMAES